MANQQQYPPQWGPSQPPNQPPRKKHTGCKIIGASLAAFIVLIVIIAVAMSGGGQTAGNPAQPAAPRSAGPSSIGQSSSRASSTQPSTNPTPAAKNSQKSAPPTAASSPGNSTVAVSASVTDPLASTAVKLLTRYFKAINDKDFSGFHSVFAPGYRDSFTPSSFSGFSSSHDSHARVTGMSPSTGGGREVRLSFTSKQDASDGPNGETCTNWKLRFYLEPVTGGGYLFGRPPASYHAKYSACPGITSARKHKPAPQPQETFGEQEAVKSAEQYLSMGQGFSKKGLMGQLDSRYGEGFSKADAKYAVNHVTVDWNQQAVLAAKNYLNTEPMSQSALVDQLHSPYGDGFTLAQAQYGARVAYQNR